VAISLIGGIERFELDRIAKRYGIPFVERPLPTDEEVEALVAQRVTALLEARLRDRDKLQTERSRRFVPLARSLAESEDELALIAMLLDDYYQQALHAPPAAPAGAAPAPAPAAQGQPSSRDSERGRGRRRSRRPGPRT
jgi:ATP-dependent RNA helicase DeaD